jgi:nitrite reductase/ring-hydroxylating ferredoxin subunit
VISEDGSVSELTWVEVAKVGDIEEDDAKQVKIGDLCIAIFNVDGAHYATGDVCTHAHAFLSEGYIQDGKVECPLHQGVFSIKTGKALNPPVTKDLETFATKVEGDTILVAVPAR